MKHLIILILLFPFIGYSFPSDSLDIIDISTISNSSTKILPFDRPFYIKVPAEKGKKLIGLDVYKKNSRGNYAKFSCTERKRMKAIYGIDNVSEYIYTEGKRKKKHRLMYIHLTEDFTKSDKKFHYIKIFPLNPATEYEFKINYLENEKLRKDSQSALDTYTNDVYYDSLLEKIDTLNYRYNKLSSLVSQKKHELESNNYSFTGRRKLKKKIKLAETKLNQIEKVLVDSIGAVEFKIWIEKVHGDKSLAMQYLYRFDSVNVKYSYDNEELLSTSINKVCLLEQNLENFRVNIEPAIDCYSKLILDLSACDSCGYMPQFGKKSYNLNKLELLVTQTDLTLSNVSSGLIPINSSNNDDLVNTDDFTKRHQNIEATIEYLEEISAIAYALGSSECKDLTKVLERLQIYGSKLKEIGLEQKANNEKILNYKLGVSGILPFGRYTQQSTHGITNGGTTAESKGKFIARPDIGVGWVSNGLVPQTQNYFNTIVPFYGVRFNFRPLDPNYPYRLIIRKSILHRSSVNVSFSFTSISNGLNRFDLYKKINFLFGYGLRLNNAMNLSAGAIFHQRLDPNPFVSERKLGVMPYIGITFDFEILEAIKDIKDVFK
ncbi:MAG: hypothetical protein ABJG68_09825 [Crocinitomicaceae bacterium]